MSVEYSIIKVHQGPIIDDEELTLMQLSRLCPLRPALLVEMVEEGILEPTGNTVCGWRFSFATIELVRRVQRIRNDLDVNLAGVALALELLEKIESLQSEILILNSAHPA